MQPNSSFDLNQFHAKRRNVEKGLELIRKGAAAIGVSSASNDIERQITGLREDRFKLVVAGEFSQGKSTFVNALLGERLLPSSPTPTTAILNRLRNGTPPCITLVQKDGSRTTGLDASAFKKLVAPLEPVKGDSESEKEYQSRIEDLRCISYADVVWPLPMIGDDVELVDTPGTNDLDPMREKITYDFIPNSDAAIFLLSARAITSESEIQFLKDRILKADIQRIFFVINFSDTLTNDEDRDRVVEAAHHALRPLVQNPRVFLVSARSALAHRLVAAGKPAKGADAMPFQKTGFPELERELGRFLAEERGWIKLAKPVEHGKRVAGEVLKGPLMLARVALGADLNEVENRISSLRPELGRLRAERDRSLSALATALRDGGRQLESSLRRGLEDIADVAAAAVRNYAGPMTTEDLARDVEVFVAPRQTELQERIRAQQNTLLAEECGRAQRRLGAAWQEFYVKMDEIFQPEASTAIAGRNEALVTTSTNHELVASNPAAASGIWELVGYVVLTLISIPFAMLDSMQRERFLGRARFEIDRRYRNGIPAVANDFSVRWSEACARVTRNMATACNRNLAGLEAQLIQLLEEHRLQSGRAEQRRADLDHCESDLRSGIAALEAAGAEGTD